MLKKDIFYERIRTRDLLLEYDPHILPLKPRSAGLAMVYPWEDISLSVLNHQLYLLALQHGFNGTENDFNRLFFAYIGTRDIVFSIYQDFPEEGSTSKLYFDLEEKILYYWDNEYIPVNAMLIANTTINGGEA